MNRMCRVWRARVRQNRNFREQAAHRMSLGGSTLKRVHLEDSDHALNQLRFVLELARAEQVADDVLRVGVPGGRTETLISMMLHRFDVDVPSSRVGFLFQQNPQRCDAIELNANRIRI